MIVKIFNNKALFRLDKGEEIIESIKKICSDNKISLGTVAGIGATNKATVGLFNIDSKKYYSKDFAGNFEISSLAGNISTMNKELYLHLHISICDDKHKSYGGHLNSAIVSATFEGVIDIIEGHIDRKFSKEIGLNLMEF